MGWDNHKNKQNRLAVGKITTTDRESENAGLQ